ncbi:DUF2017 family protein [Haloechinothrix halophila]|uniref:DUF2017 family protein n=1 Tax=Haloechinothrix halophila TaxID=1069073 RepID=UPI00042708E4|nr:hypothetical protein [Haloechinothrix halophila]
MEGYIEAISLDDGAIRLTLSPDVAGTVRTSVGQFIEALETGRRPGVLRRRLSNWRLFAHAYPRPKPSRQFRQRHNGWMRESLHASACRIRDAWPDEPTFVLDRAAIADWFAVCGQAQTLYIHRRSPNPLQGSFGHGKAFWLAQVQQYVATAACGHDWQRLLEYDDQQDSQGD